MFREALIQKDIPKKEFEENEAKLREQLLIAQERLKKLNSQLLINISGTDRFGNQKVLSRLHQWFDPRYLVTRVFQFNFKQLNSINNMKILNKKEMKRINTNGKKSDGYHYDIDEVNNNTGCLYVFLIIFLFMVNLIF